MDYLFLEVNPSFEKQTGIENARGKSMRAIAPHHEAHWFDMFGHIAVTGEPRRFEYPAAGLARWYAGYAYRMGDADEGKVGVLFSDITERKEAEAQLNHLNDELERRVAERTEELVRSQQRLRDMAAELNVTEQRERQRLAAELHDNLGQLLALSRIKLGQARQQPMPASAAKFIGDLDDVIQKALTYTRTLVSQLSPLALIESGLPMALQWLTEQMHHQDLSVVLQVKTKIPALPRDQALLLFQSVRELLINCVKHAGTQKATMTLEWVHGSLYIQISDQGAGFDPHASASTNASAPAPGFGLLSIRERMLTLGGRFELESSPGKGTIARLVLPLPDSIAESLFIASPSVILAEVKEPTNNREQAPPVTAAPFINAAQGSTTA